jgi:hypothetical protein
LYDAKVCRQFAIEWGPIRDYRRLNSPGSLPPFTLIIIPSISSPYCLTINFTLSDLILFSTFNASAVITSKQPVPLPSNHISSCLSSKRTCLYPPIQSLIFDVIESALSPAAKSNLISRRTTLSVKSKSVWRRRKASRPCNNDSFMAESRWQMRRLQRIMHWRVDARYTWF